MFASSSASCEALRAEVPPPPPFGARPALGDAGGGPAALSFPLLDFSLAESLDALAPVAAAPLPPPFGEAGGFGGIVVARQL